MAGGAVCGANMPTPRPTKRTAPDPGRSRIFTAPIRRARRVAYQRADRLHLASRHWSGFRSGPAGARSGPRDLCALPQHGSARQVLLSLAAEQMHFPRPSDGKKLVSFEWTPIRYRSVMSILKNPFYAGAYAYGKSQKRTALIEGRARTTYKHRKPIDQWEVIIKEHHEGYIEWSELNAIKSCSRRMPTGRPTESSPDAVVAPC